MWYCGEEVCVTDLRSEFRVVWSGKPVDDAAQNMDATHTNEALVAVGEPPGALGVDAAQGILDERLGAVVVAVLMRQHQLLVGPGSILA